LLIYRTLTNPKLTFPNIIMNNQPKFLKYLILIAVTIFIVTAIYKYTSVDNSEQVTVPTQQIEPKANFKERTEHKNDTKKATVATTNASDDITPDDIEATNSSYSELPLKERMQKQRDASQKAMYQALFFKTPEDIIKAIDAARKQGDTAKESEYIDLLISKYPDYSL